jgi:hypothetical protein
MRQDLRFFDDINNTFVETETGSKLTQANMKFSVLVKNHVETGRQVSTVSTVALQYYPFLTCNCMYVQDFPDMWRQCRDIHANSTVIHSL